jgi:quercetin dioxygenase-like cupin family protein
VKTLVVATLLALASLVLVACSPASTETNKSATPAVNATPAPAPDAVSVDPTHYTVLFENDIARLLRTKYPAGAKSVMHNHPAGCGIFLADQTFKFTSQAGADQTVENHLGDVTCGDAEDHLPQNAGDKDAELIILELKNRKTFDNVKTGKSITVASQPNVPDAIAGDPQHYSVEFENDVVRLLRIKLAPGGKAPKHAHPANCVVELRAWTATDTAGAPQPTEVKAGDAGCGDAMSHSAANVGKTPAEIIVIEFKNRDKFKT